jgi:putative heme iron utilization protein
LAEVGEGDPLAHPRLSLIGRGEKIVDAGMREVCKARFLNKHPKSALYADFSDFAFWRVELEEAHLNGGFARAAKFSGAEVKTDISEADELIEGEAGALAHLNSDHQDTLALYAKVLAHQVEGPWQAIGIDPEGLDLGLADLTARIVFPDKVETLASLRHTLVRLAQALK